MIDRSTVTTTSMATLLLPRARMVFECWCWWHCGENNRRPPCRHWFCGSRCYFYRPQRSCGKVMFLHLSVSHSVHRGDTPPPADTPLPSAYWDTHPPGRHHTGQTPSFPVHAGIPTPSACWDTPPCAVHAGIRSTSGRYASHWNAYF